MKVKWSLQQIYFYLVCFVTLIMVIVGAVNTVRAAVDVILPSPDNIGSYYMTTPMEAKFVDGEYRDLFDPEVVEKELARQNTINRKNSVNQSIKNLMGGVFLILVAGPVYIYHWRYISSLEQD